MRAKAACSRSTVSCMNTKNEARRHSYGRSCSGPDCFSGDGMITPAISVVSAVEGLQVATPALSNVVIPITIGLLTGLFAIQYKGTSGIGIVFGPILVVWFAVIAGLGVLQIGLRPEILAAFNPIYGFAFLRHVGLFEAHVVLSALMLVVTGGEAMYSVSFSTRKSGSFRSSWNCVERPGNWAGSAARSKLQMAIKRRPFLKPSIRFMIACRSSNGTWTSPIKTKTLSSSRQPMAIARPFQLCRFPSSPPPPKSLTGKCLQPSREKIPTSTLSSDLRYSTCSSRSLRMVIRQFVSSGRIRTISSHEFNVGDEPSVFRIVDRFAVEWFG